MATFLYIHLKRFNYLMDISDTESYLYTYTSDVYKYFNIQAMFQDDTEFKKRIINSSGEFNPYVLYSMKILSLMEKECLNNILFDQEHGFSLRKTNHNDGNHYIHLNEIKYIANELKIRPKSEEFILQIFMRVRVLSILNKWNPDIDCDTLYYKQEESPIFLEECKKYFKGSKKYLRYTRLLKAAIDNAIIFEKPIKMPSTLKEYKEFLKNPFVYVILEPYNYILSHTENDYHIIHGKIINGEIHLF